MIIRRTPDDFVVRELLTEHVRAELRPDPSPEHDHAVYALRKVSLTTPEACGRLARALNVKPALLSHAGLKDKHAVTEQHVTCERKPADAPPPPGELAGPGWSARLMGFAPQHARAAWIERNEFVIVIRSMNRADAAEMLRRLGVLALPEPGSPVGPRSGRALMVNYFGDQRFGSARHGEGFVAQRLIAGDFEGALRLAIGTPARKDVGAQRVFTRACAQLWGQWKTLVKKLPATAHRPAIEALAAGREPRTAYLALPAHERTLHAEAFQSLLWNDAARLLVTRLAGTPERCVRAGDDFGELLFPPATMIDEPTREINAPMPAPDMPQLGPWGSAVRAALHARELAMEDLSVPGFSRPLFGTADRPLFVTASALELGACENDELAPKNSTKPLKRTVRFTLPRGAYATVLLRALGQ